MTYAKTLAISFALVLGAASHAQAQGAAATAPPSPSVAEAAFVATATADLTKRFPTPAAAEKAGYERFTNEDSTGAISYANRQWTSVDAKHPSQLWFDVKGRLIGADYSVPYTETRPNVWGIDPQRWSRFGVHVHYGLAGPNGTTIYGGLRAKAYAAAGGDPLHADAAGLVKAGVTKSVDQVKFVFTFPGIWDLGIWLVPNPNGPFADANPNVTPSSNAEKPM